MSFNHLSYIFHYFLFFVGVIISYNFYHACLPRERFDLLVGKIGDLEKEKLSLLETMKDATTPNGSSKEPTKGAGGGRGGSAEALRERLKVRQYCRRRLWKVQYDVVACAYSTGLARS